MAESKNNKAIITGIVLIGLAVAGYFLYRKFGKDDTAPKEETKVLKDAYDNLVFETGKDVIKQISFPHLDVLADALSKEPKWKLTLSGHTDNTGSSDFNQKLSVNRANSVKKYLVSKGITNDRITTAGFGSTVPIADNTTVEGREKNRRVEFAIVKEEGQVITT